MTKITRRPAAAQVTASKKVRSLRTFLLMQQFAAEEIGARIKQARNERGITQEQLAEMASFSKRSLQDYENGVTIPYRHMREISEILARAVEWFLHGDAGEGDASQNERLVRIEAQLAEIRGLLAGQERAATEEPSAGQDDRQQGREQAG